MNLLLTIGFTLVQVASADLPSKPQSMTAYHQDSGLHVLAGTITGEVLHLDGANLQPARGRGWVSRSPNDKSVFSGD